ncbi:MAG: tetraacyldisaccharide 4'-kinase [Acidobacteriota bacterium]|nr:tetraacyldisaccharide 4'-kinase [Acidobacteriota bacterium]
MNSEATAYKVPAPSMSPWQRLYGGGHRLRRAWYRRRASRLPRPVISVGNLHWGGTGKTPLTASIAARLRDQGRQVAILSRGYGSRGSGVRVVSTGSGPLLGPLAAGDEPVLLAGELQGVSVVVAADRYRAGQLALERLPTTPDVFLLDDGFSHVRLARDIDILVFPPDDPMAGGRLPPSGRLREPLTSVRHANAIVWSLPERPTQAAGRRPDENAADWRPEELTAGLAQYGFTGRSFSSYTTVLPPTHKRQEPVPEGASVFLVTGIARPGRVAKALASLPYELVGSLAFPDHHSYPDESLRQIERAWRESGAAWVVTTGKDHVKLLGRLETPLAELPLRARPEEAFWSWLGSSLAQLDTEAS